MGQEVVVAAVETPSPAPAHVEASARAPKVGAPPPTSLAPGFRFYPTDVQLVRFYLRRKACGMPFPFELFKEIDVYKSEPWEVGEYSALKTRDLDWYFFSPVDKKYGNGSHLNRATGTGYWEVTGKDQYVCHKDQIVGMKKMLVFHIGRAPDGKRTNWVMHEYRLCDPELESAGVLQDAFVLCRIFQEKFPGPLVGDRYPPSIEEEWDEDDVANGDEALIEYTDLYQDTPPLDFAPLVDPTESPIIIPFASKRDRSTDPEIEPLPSAQSKRPKHDDTKSSYANRSEDSPTKVDNPPPGKMMMMKKKDDSVPLLDFPLLEPLSMKENPPSPVTFDASNLEKSVPPGYLNFIKSLENRVMDITLEKEMLKAEVMRAQSIINILQSQVDMLTVDDDSSIEDLFRRTVYP